MNTRFKKSYVAALLCVASLTANAGGWDAPAVNATIAAAKAAMMKFVTDSSALVTSLVEATGLQKIMAIGQATSAITETQKATMEANAAVADAAAKAKHAKAQDLYVQEEVLKQASALRGAPCEEVSSVAGYRVAYAANATKAAAANFSSGMLASRMKVVSQQADLENLAKVYKNKYCADDQSGNCSPVAIAMQNADIKASTVFSGAASSGGLTSTSYTPTQIEAAKDYVSNLIKPIGDPALDVNASNTPQGRAYEQMRREDMARISLAQLPWAQYIARRDPSSMPTGISDVAKGVLASLDPSVKARAASATELSYQNLMDIEVQRRYANLQWYKDVGNLSDQTIILKEIVTMKALSIKQRQDHIQMMDQLIATAATMYHERSEATNGQRLAKQRAAAVAAR